MDVVPIELDVHTVKFGDIEAVLKSIGRDKSKYSRRIFPAREYILVPSISYEPFLPAFQFWDSFPI